MIGVFMAALDNGIISAALTTINTSFEVSPTQGSWGITLYALGMAVTTPIVGKLADRYGRKKLFLIEVAIFTIGSIAVALSPTFSFFLAARLLQALGGGGIFIIASSHVLSTVAKERQGSMLGMLGGMNGIASLLGPNIGSFLIDWTGNWHWLFLINAPIGIGLVILGITSLQETKGHQLSKIDFLGITLLSLSILSVMFALNNLSTGNLLESMLHLSVFGLLVLAVLLFALLIWVEKRNEMGTEFDPILPYSLLKKPTFTLTMIMGLLTGTFIGSIIFIPSFAQQILGVSAAKSGYWMTPLALAAGIGAGGGGVLVDKRGAIPTLVLSGIISIIGFIGLAFTDTKTMFILFSTFAGIGFGFFLGAPLTVLTSNAAGEQKGSAIGTLSVARQIGLTLSPTIFATFIQNGFGQLGRIIPEKLQVIGIDPTQIPTEFRGQMERLAGAEDLQTAVSIIPDPQIQQALLEAFAEAAHAAYQPIYLFTAVAALLIIVIVVAFQRRFKKDEEQEGTAA
ncbi:transporter [Ammoniphilus oxalaticus]|uniref:Transporter n=1 Tax=Ammoniphilus oxalaticus TaxID=66863 RepID=A0A419SP83_9BACL|nr:MFS transporter [Ammoniphilus oxalaticus]RKD26063.1 transporter [Ammoniphilus oxalaticus]